MSQSAAGWPVLNEKLRAPFSPEESEEFLQLEEELIDRTNALATGSQNLNFQALHIARHQASNTLKHKPEELPYWEKTLLDFARRLEANEPLTFEVLSQWNANLRGVPDQKGLRLEEQWLCEKKLLAFAEIPDSIKDLEEFALNSTDHTLLKASRIYQWLITIHPFPNANGRTARLATDYTLIQGGLLPVVFPSPEESFVAICPENPTAITPTQAFHRTHQGVERSIEILQLPIL